MAKSPEISSSAPLPIDRARFTDAIRESYSHIYLIAYSVARDADTADDLAQETFLRAWLKLDTLKDGRLLEPWLARIVRNLAWQWHRTGRTRSRVLPLIPLEDIAVEPTDTNAATPRDKAAESERMQQLHDAVMALPDDMRETVLLHYADGISASEIARLTGEAPSTITRRLSRSHDQLRSLLEGSNARPLAGLRPGAASVAKSVAIVGAAAGLPAAGRAELIFAVSDTPLPPSPAGHFSPTHTGASAMKVSGAKLGFAKIAAAVLIAGAAVGGGTYLKSSFSANADGASKSSPYDQDTVKISRSGGQENGNEDFILRAANPGSIDSEKSLPRDPRRRALAAAAARIPDKTKISTESAVQNTTSDSAATSASIATITGVIRDKVTSQPIANALVRAALGAPDMRGVREDLNKKSFPETHTDSAGRYTFELALNDGTTSVALDAFSPGYRSLAGTFMSGGDFTAANIPVSPGETITKDVLLPAAMYVAARVIDETGKPLRDVRVKGTIDHDNGGMAFIANAITDKNGEFQLFDYPPSAQKEEDHITAGMIELKRDDLVTTHVKDVYSIAEPQRHDLQIVMSAGTHITGQLLTASGEPATSVPLHIQYGAEYRGERRDISTDLSGNFELAGLPPGKAKLYARSMQIHQVLRTEIELPTSNTLTLQMVSMPAVDTSDAIDLLGMKLINNNEQLTDAYQLYKTTGVLVLDAGTARAKFDGEASEASLAEGSLIFLVGDKRISSLRDLATEIVRVNNMEKPKTWIDEGYKGYVRFAFNWPKEFGNFASTQYMHVTPEDIAGLEAYLEAHPGPGGR